jgi:hypothetical protein
MNNHRFRLGILAALLTFVFAGVGCDLLEPCNSYLEETWTVSPDYSGEESWCQGLCDFTGRAYDKVTRVRTSGGDRLSCYCCR